MTLRRMSEVADWLDDLISVVHANLDELGERVGRQLDNPTPSTSDIDIEERARAMTADADTPVIGAGIVVEPHSLVDADYWMDWWSIARPGTANTVTQRHHIHQPPVGQGDFTASSWYATPKRTGLPFVAGPYVDYEHTYAYILTVTQGFSIGSRFGGVVGADMHVGWLENVLQPMLGQVPTPTCLVTETGRVIASADSQLMCGDRLTGEGLDLLRPVQDAGSPWLTRRCRRLPFVIVSRTA